MNETTPHHLALKASEAIRQSPHRGLTGVAQIIHTAAIQPVLKAGEEVASALEHFIVIQIVQTPGWLETAEGQSCQSALTQWRTLTSPEKANPTPLAGSRSDFDAKSDSGDRKGGL